MLGSSRLQNLYYRSCFKGVMQQTSGCSIQRPESSRTIWHSARYVSQQSSVTLGINPNVYHLSTKQNTIEGVQSSQETNSGYHKNNRTVLYAQRSSGNAQNCDFNYTKENLFQTMSSGVLIKCRAFPCLEFLSQIF